MWPSAYASGALVKCRKKGAANWGNSSKKEETELPGKSIDEACWKTHEQRGMKKKGGKMVPNCVPKGTVSEEQVDEACWKGYEKKGMKTMFGKRYPNCVKKTKRKKWRCLDDMINMFEDDMKGMSVKSGDKRSTESGAGMTAQGVLSTSIVAAIPVLN